MQVSNLELQRKVMQKSIEPSFNLVKDIFTSIFPRWGGGSSIPRHGALKGSCEYRNEWTYILYLDIRG